MQPDFLRKERGREGEAEAARYLQKEGFRILEKNYRSRYGEIDLIAEKEGDLFFVEVKARHSFDSVSPLELIPPQKQRHISLMAQHYYAEKEISNRTGRFGLVIVDLANKKCEWLADIFELAWGY